MTKSEISTIAGTLALECREPGDWQFEMAKVSSEYNGELEILKINMRADRPSVPPEFRVAALTPQDDFQHRWTAVNKTMGIPPNWWSEMNTQLAVGMPVVALINQRGENRLSVVVSEAKRLVKLYSGIVEEGCLVENAMRFFCIPEAPLAFYEVFIRFDRRRINFADAIRDASNWFTTFPEYKPCLPPAAAYEPLYSTWYNFHQNVFDHEIEAECAIAAKLGMKSIILDDGWQTEDTHRGYAYCGDWAVSPRRFPDMHGHVAKIHALGMKYLVWYSVPFVGFESAALERFHGKFLNEAVGLHAYVLDPRFPEVRDYLIGTYEQALLDWDIDGFKLDFIDQFTTPNPDPAVAEHYAGRDIMTVSEAVDVLLSETMKRLKKIKPDILIEFRQSYIGPAIRKYGNMFRAGDCPADVVMNRVRTTDLRLTSGDTAVHADMLEWNAIESAECAALQILNVVFSVVQLSVILRTLSEEHRLMVAFWLGFCRRHQETLLRSGFTPEHPELNYPVISAESAGERITAVYEATSVVRIGATAGKTYYVINATGEDSLVLDLRAEPKAIEMYDTCGRVMTPPPRAAGLIRIRFAKSGLLKLVF